MSYMIFFIFFQLKEFLILNLPLNYILRVQFKLKNRGGVGRRRKGEKEVRRRK